MKFEREKRYIVIKLSDSAELSDSDIDDLDTICAKISMIRIERGKRELNCVVVEDDWPEYEFVWKMIEFRITKCKDSLLDYFFRWVEMARN